MRIFMFKISLKKVIFTITLLLCVFPVFFRGHIFISQEGYLLLKRTPEKHTDIGEDTPYYVYDAVINGNSISILSESLYSPMKITSEKLGDLEIAILADLKDGVKKVQKSESFYRVEESKYSKRQINLLYKYFDYYFSENRVLTIPYYGYRQQRSLFGGYQERTVIYLRFFISVGLLIFIFLKYGKLDAKRKNAMKHIFVVLGVLIALYLSYGEIVTIL